MNAARTETRVTPWTECVGGPWFPSLSHGGFAAYRIWQQFDGFRWYQRHEWKRADSSFEMEAWINGAAGWCSRSEPVDHVALAA